MICEMCGKQSEYTKTIFIEGTQLKVCKECSRFGESSDGKGGGKKSATGAAPSRAMVAERLQARERRMRTRDVYQEGETTAVDLVPEYARIIRDARMARNLKQEELAAKLNERVSIVAKLENGSIRPSDTLIKKLEKELGVKLTEKVSVVKTEGGHSAGKVLTLGDLIKKK
jgi:putative transcription factor